MVPFSLPSFAPSNLQHNLLSYLVRRFLGPLLKHGAQSLDHQLATPIQPGIFTIKDVQLDPKALQDQLSGSFSPLTIQAVSVSELSLQINWPSWSFSLQGYVPDVKLSFKDVQVTLGISEPQPNQSSTQYEAPSHLLTTINLDENLATIANDFVSQEWSESSAYEDQTEHDFPGAFTIKNSSASTSSSGDQDQRGFFTGLVQKILAKVNFELNHLTIILNHQDIQVLLSIDNITSLDLASDDIHPSSSISREIRTSCPVLYLQPRSDQVQADLPSSPNSSSNQSFDSEHDMLMSQATVDLRRPASLFVSAAETLDLIHERDLHEQSPPSEPIMNPENILVQFVGTTTNNPAQAPEPSTESPVPSEQKLSSYEGSADHLDPNNSLRFLFWILSSSSSSPTEQTTPNTNQPGPTGPPNQDTTSESITPRSQLNIQIYLPILTVSIRLPQHLNALNQLVASFISATPSTSTNSQSNLSVSAPETTPFTISTELKLHALNCTLAFLAPYPQLATPPDDTPLSSISVHARLINLVFNTPLAHPDTENQAAQTRSKVTLRVDQIKGVSEIIHTSSTSVFLLAPARDAHPSPAVSINQTTDTTQIVFSSIWLNLDLEVVAVLIPLVEAVQSSFIINRTGSSDVSGDADHSAFVPPTLSHHSIEDGLSNFKKQDKFTTTVSIPCLYIDIKSHNQREPTIDRSQTESVLGSVLKTFQVIVTSERQIGCSIFEVALGFRVSNLVEERAHAPLSPFLGIAHPCIPHSKEQQNRFPCLRLTHILSPPQSPKLTQTCTDPGQRPTSLKLETVTVDFSKEQFDRLQYWLDDLGRWANSLFIDSPPTSSNPHVDTHNQAQNRSRQPKAGSGRQQESSKLEDSAPDDNHKGLESLVGTLTVSNIALTIRLPSDETQSQSPRSPPKLVIQFGLLSIHQLRLPLQHKFDDQIRLLIHSCSAALHYNSASPPLPILYQTLHQLQKNSPKTSDSSAVSVSVFTTQSQSNDTNNNNQAPPKKILLDLQVNRSIVRLGPSCLWTSELARFLKAPAGVFEAVGPEYQSQINVELVGCAIELVSPPPSLLPSPSSTTTASGSTLDDYALKDNQNCSASAFILQIMATRARLNIALDPSSTVVYPSLDASVVVSLAECSSSSSSVQSEQLSFAEIAALNELTISFIYSWPPGLPTCRTTFNQGHLTISLCADSTDSLAEVISRLSEIPFQAKSDPSRDHVELLPPVQRVEDPIAASTMLKSAMRESSSPSRSILIQKDEDLAEEDYPTDVAFLDQKQPASSQHHHHHHHHVVTPNPPAILRPLSDQGLNIIDDYMLNIPISSKLSGQPIETEVQVENLDVVVRFYDGYDWNSTRQTIQQAQKTVRKRLQKIRQLLATGNPADARSMEEDLGPTTLFKSVHLGLDSSTRGLSGAQLLDAIDDQLDKEAVEPVNDDPESMAGSWQSLTAHPSNNPPQTRLVSHSSSKQQDLGRSTQPMLKIILDGVQGHFRKYHETARQTEPNKDDRTNECRLSSLQLKTDTLTIIDNIPTSTWKKFLTELRPGEGGMMRPTGAPMVRFKFVVTPSSRDSCLKEAIIKLKISPLRLYVDQDAVDFLKTFFSFQKHVTPPSSSAPDPTGPPADELFFQRVEILPIRIKLDYKPKRVNYMALKEGKTIELMNFFHFEGSDMVLRHATLTGISRASKIGELLQEIWTPDVKANQLADVISGIAPVRSVVNLGTGIADLVLLPIEEMKKKDGRLSRGIQKGTSSFAKNTTLEMIKLGARLAIGTQVILEKAESILGASKVNHPLHGETIDHLLSPQHPSASTPSDPTSLNHHHHPERLSKYALQPQTFTLGAQSAYHDLRDNFRSTAQTILAVPLEVFNEGSGQAVVKAIPIAILHPMVGATGAISKTLLGLHNSLDPQTSASLLLDKYKQLPSPHSPP